MNIGVFDSGVGGLSVANAIKKAVPDADILYVNDYQNVPYGTKTPEQLLTLVRPIFEDMVRQRCNVIVVACNSVTTTIIDELRQHVKVPLIGMEPMVKPAAQLTQSGAIAVCATPTTLASKRYTWLKDTYAARVTVIEPDCSEWTNMIEHKRIDRQKIHDPIVAACNEGADVIVLGCTHYHWIEDLIKDTVAGRATVLQPEVPVISELKRVLAQLA
jgi:glutamate racemase